MKKYLNKNKVLKNWKNVSMCVPILISNHFLFWCRACHHLCISIHLIFIIGKFKIMLYMSSQLHIDIRHSKDKKCEINYKYKYSLNVFSSLLTQCMEKGFEKQVLVVNGQFGRLNTINENYCERLATIISEWNSFVCVCACVCEHQPSLCICLEIIFDVTVLFSLTLSFKCLENSSEV